MRITIAKRYLTVNSNPLVPTRSKLLSNAPMNEAKETRRVRMLALAAEAGSLEALADKTGTDPRYLSQIKNRWKGRGMGAALARRIEEKLGKPHGWMDQPLQAEGTSYSTERPASGGQLQSPQFHRLDGERQSLILGLFEQLTRPQQDEYLRQIQTTVEANNVVVREFGDRNKSPGKKPDS